MESLCGIHETLFHGVLVESSVFQTVPLDSTWSLHRLLMDSTWSPWRLLGTSRKCGMESSWTLHGVSVESPWSPHGVHGDSLWTPQSLHGLHGNPWVSVKYSICRSWKFRSNRIVILNLFQCLPKIVYNHKNIHIHSSDD